MKSENSKTSDSYRLLINLSDKINLKTSDKYVALSNISIYYTWKYIKRSYKKINTAPTWNDKFEFSDGSYSVSVYHQKHEKVTDNPPIRIYVHRMENGITFKIKTGYYLELS